MKKKIVLMILTAITLMHTAFAATDGDFSDVPSSHWAYPYISQMVEEGVLGGYSDGTFQPGIPMKRSEFSTALAKIAGLSLTDANSSFDDVNNHWAKQYIVAVTPYIGGISSSAFEPDREITRETTVAALVKIKGYDVSNINMSAVNTFADFDEISSELQPYMAFAVEHGMVNGYEDNTLRPKGSLSRAEACVLLYKAFHYEIDTIVSNLFGFRSMVMDKDNNIYYIDENTVYSTKTNKVLNLWTDFSTEISNPYLAYDPYNDVIYLLGGGSLTIYDITDFDSPTLILDENNCPALLRSGGCGGKLMSVSQVTPQIAVIENGSLLIPFEGNGTWMVNPQTKTVVQTVRIYSLMSPYYSKIVDGKVMKFREDSMDATVSELLFGTDTSVEIELDVEAPYDNGNTMCADGDAVYFYLDSIGVCCFTIDGSAYLFIPQEYIAIKDYQGLDNTNIWGIAVGSYDHVAFYDNSLKAIRLICPVK